MKKEDKYSMLHSETSELLLEQGELLYGATSQYMVSEILGEGCFGKVVECRDLNSFEKVAIKVLKDHVKDTMHEVDMLDTISVLDPDQNNLVRFIECFKTKGHRCLAFEKLDMTLIDLVKQQGFMPVGLDDIRDTAEQLLVALAGLKEVGVVHADIKPDNIMVVRAGETPKKVKLVDFGLSGPVSKVYPGMGIQAIGYRAPEICLGLPFTVAVDVWGLGCVLAFLFLGWDIFPFHCEYQMMKSIVKLLGQPPDHQLAQGMYSRYFFIEDRVDNGETRWRLMTPEEFSAVNPMPAEKERRSFKSPGSLDDLLQIHPVQDQSEWEDRAALVDLLKGLLHLDGEQRLTPCAALQHPFITRSYRNQGPLPGPSQDPISRPTLDLPAGFPEDPLNMPDPLGEPLKDPNNGLDLLVGPPEDPHNGLNPPSGPREDPHNGPDPLGGPPEDPPNRLDPPSGPPEEPPYGFDLLGGPPEDPPNRLHPLSGSPEDLNSLDPLSGHSRAPNSGSSLLQTAGRGFKRVKKRIGGAFNRLRNTVELFLNSN